MQKEETIKGDLDKLQSLGLLGLPPATAFSAEVKGHPAALAWTVEHEPNSAVPGAYKADLSADPTAIWIEGEKPKTNTIKPATPWLNLESNQLSGGHWLTALGTDPSGQAVYEFEAAKDGQYNLWVREFAKNWANPTRWQIDQSPAQDTPRSLRSVSEGRADLGAGRGVYWCKYGQVELKADKHTLTVSVVPGRTVGSADAEPAKDVIWAVDAFCLTTANAPPKTVVIEPTPISPPEVEKAAYEKLKAADPQALAWNILGAGFFPPYSNKLARHYYDDWSKYTDITSFDLYPVTGWDAPGNLPHVGLATRKLVSLSRPGEPVWTIVEASDQQLSWTSPRTRGSTGQEMRAEVWSAVANGAKGIGYFTIAFGRGKNFQWNHLTEEIQAELKRTNAELTELAGPIVLGDTRKTLVVSGDETKDQAAEGRAIQAIRKDYEGKSYVIAVNVTREAARPTFKLDSAPGATAALFKESRRIDLKDGSFSDDFKPLDVHVYVIVK
jgi:hypothetical protein